jgi:hypothetical protein
MHWRKLVARWFPRSEEAIPATQVATESAVTAAARYRSEEVGTVAIIPNEDHDVVIVWTTDWVQSEPTLILTPGDGVVFAALLNLTPVIAFTPPEE